MNNQVDRRLTGPVMLLLLLLSSSCAAAAGLRSFSRKDLLNRLRKPTPNPSNKSIFMNQNITEWEVIKYL